MNRPHGAAIRAALRKPMLTRERIRAGARWTLLEIASAGALLTILVGVAAAFAWPWLAEPALGGPTLARYVPLRDASSVLVARYDGSGTPLGWESRNSALTPWLGLYSELRQAPNNLLLNTYSTPDDKDVEFQELQRRLQSRAQVITTRVRTLDRAGSVVPSTIYSVREARGEVLAGVYTPATNNDVTFDPPLLGLPADLDVGSEWTSEGRVQSVGTPYRFTGRVAEAGAVGGPLGTLDDCLRVESRLVVSQGERTLRDWSASTWYCADVGLVESRQRDGLTGEETREVTVGTEGSAAARSLPTVPAAGPGMAERAAAASDALGNPSAWELTRVGRARTVVDAGESTVPPTWIPTDPPVVLVAGFAGDQLALDAGDDLGTIRWRFHTGSTIYSPPALDPARGRIYVGSSDRRVYALDASGLFLWSFDTGDNVTARPLPVGDLVIVGSEDRTVYALDADSGTLRWQISTDGAVVSSPVLAGGVVAVGSDDGTVYGLDPATGERHWTYAAGGAVEAPLVFEDGTLYVASRDGTLAAVSTSECSNPCSARWEANGDHVLRTAPAVGGGRVFVVDEDGYVVAFDAEEGRRLWSTPPTRFVGPPVVVGDRLLVARSNGTVARLTLDGDLEDIWTAGDTSGPLDGNPQFLRGPVVGGDALWLGDDAAVVWRLGQPDRTRGVATVRSAWTLAAGRPPFDGNQLIYTAASYEGVAVVLDSARHVYAVNPTSGRASRYATLDGDGFMYPTEPVVANDTLLAVVGFGRNVLHAFDLTSAQDRWTLQANGTAYRPPTAVGDTVLWLTSLVQPAGSASGSGRGVLQALALDDGQARWQVPLSGIAFVGGATVRGETVYISSPPTALDLATGAVRWQVDAPGYGGPALDAAGEMLAVATIDPETERGQVVALDAATGRLRWRAELGQELMPATEQLAVDGGTVIVSTAYGNLVGLDSGTGDERWRFRPAAPRLGTVTVADGRAWMLLENADIVAVDTRTGRVAARLHDLNVNLNGQGITQRVAMIDGQAVVPTGRMLVGFALP
jgi:outer membrane protein assembly factor BamB